MYIKGEKIEIKPTRRRHQSGFKIINVSVDEKQVSEGVSDLVNLKLQGGIYQIDVTKDGTICFYHWGDFRNKYKFSLLKSDTSTVWVEEEARESKSKDF